MSKGRLRLSSVGLWYLAIAIAAAFFLSGAAMLGYSNISLLALLAPLWLPLALAVAWALILYCWHFPRILRRLWREAREERRRKSPWKK